MEALRTVQVTRYITPLREGGSLPAIVEADDDFKYVIKFRGAGQGPKALIAEFIGGALAKNIGFNIPELVFAELDAAFGQTEPDEEIQDLLKASTGLNLGLHYLSGAITFDPAVFKVDPLLASMIVWFDAFLTNVDRTAKNTNMLTWNNQLWLIDHGAALYFHHSWANWEEQSEKPFVQIKDHVLLPYAGKLEEANEKMRTLVKEETLTNIVEKVPQDWLVSIDPFDEIENIRNVYINFLINRLHHATNFLNEALHAR